MTQENEKKCTEVKNLEDKVKILEIEISTLQTNIISKENNYLTVIF